MDSSSDVTFDIHCAAYLGDSDTVESSMECDNLNKRNRGEWTPLMYACSSQHLLIMELLLLRGAIATVPGARGLTPLMISSRRGDLGAIELLLRYNRTLKESIESKDINGWTALFHAVFMGQEEAVKLLLSKGANANAIDSNRFNVLTLAERVREEKGGNIVQILVDAGAGYLSPACEAPWLRPISGHQNDLLSLFKLLGVEKYWKIFNDLNIGIQQFIMLQDEDLKFLGVKLLGPRRKMATAISQLKRNT